MKKKSTAALIIAGFVLTMSYTNCAQFAGSDYDSSSLMSAATFNLQDICTQTDPTYLFRSTYQPFLSANCAGCHVGGGLAKDYPFADSNLTVAFDQFGKTGHVKISEYAVNAGHKAPYTGPQHTETIEALKVQYTQGNQALASCANGTGTPVGDLGPRLETIPKSLANLRAGTNTELSWTLPADLSPTSAKKDTAAVTLSIQAKILVNSTGIRSYYFSKPAIRSTAGDVRLSSLRFKINGNFFSYDTTFAKLEGFGYNNDTTEMNPSGALFNISPSSSDQLALSIETIRLVNTNDPNDALPIKPLDLLVGFQSTTLSSPRSGLAEVRLTLSQPTTVPVVVSVSVDEAATTAESEFITLKISQPAFEGFVSRFDWDFKLDASTATQTFLPGGPTTLSLFIPIAASQRAEPAETIKLNLAVTGGSRDPAKSTLTINLPAQTETAPGTATISRFSELMGMVNITGKEFRPTGTLSMNCLKCHNSLSDREGPFDLTDYAAMISTGRLKPSDPTGSAVYMRMIDVPENATSMPKTGYLERTEVDFEVKRWITDGAKNN